MYYLNAWLKRCFFNLDLKWETQHKLYILDNLGIFSGYDEMYN